MPINLDGAHAPNHRRRCRSSVITPPSATPFLRPHSLPHAPRRQIFISPCRHKRRRRRRSSVVKGAGSPSSRTRPRSSSSPARSPSITRRPVSVSPPPFPHRPVSIVPSRPCAITGSDSEMTAKEKHPRRQAGLNDWQGW